MDDAGLPPPTASTSGAPATVSPNAPATATAEKVEEPKKKRGFWGRIFGRGDDDKKKEEERKKEEEERKKAEERRRRGGG